VRCGNRHECGTDFGPMGFVYFRAIEISRGFTQRCKLAVTCGWLIRPITFSSKRWAL
jgi:hypothetical protein